MAEAINLFETTWARCRPGRLIYAQTIIIFFPNTSAAAQHPRFFAEVWSLDRLVTPIVVALAAAVLIGVVDTIMIAPLGTTALAGASIAASVILIFYSALYGLVSVCGVLIAQAFGAKEDTAVGINVKASLVVPMLVGLVRSRTDGRGSSKGQSMSKLMKRFVESVIPKNKGHVIWDDELPCFSLRIYPSGKRSYLVQYKAKGRSRR